MMERKISFLRRNSGFLLVAALSLVFPSCLNTKPKVLGTKKVNLFEGTDGSQSSFKFNFALKGTTVGNDTPIYLQGSANTSSGLISTCNTAGTGCVCEFLKADGSIIQTTISTSYITYDTTGNYYTCTLNDPGATLLPQLTDIRIRNIGNTVTSSNLVVTASGALTIEQLIGTDLDVNRVRSVYRYECEWNYLQKDGTNSNTFDCSTQATLCDTGDFCLLKAQFPYYVYADGYSTNFHLKVADELYNPASGRICNQQIKKYDCTLTAPALKFGLYAEQTGIWATNVALGPAPGITATSMGFAAKVSTTTNLCPPGLEKRVFWTVTVDTSTILPTHNFTTGQVSTEVQEPAPSAPPTDFEIDKYGQGDCNGTSCTMPVSYAGDATPDQAYSSAGATEFCVIPKDMID